MSAAVFLAVLALLAALAPGVASAQPSYEPPVWKPAPGQNVTTVRWGPMTIPAAPSMEDPMASAAMPDHGAMPAGELDNQIALDGGCNPLLSTWGPVSPYKVSCIPMSIPKPCDDCYITGILPDLVKKGTDTSVNMNNGGMLHHVVLMNLNRQDATCPAWGGFKPINWLGLLNGGNERFFAAGNERTIAQLNTAGTYGYRVNKGDRWGLIYHLMNYTQQPMDVEFKFTFTWVRKATPVDPVWLDIDQCSDSEKKIPAGYSDLEWSTPVLRGGTLVGVGGHAHDHSIAVSLENVTKKKFSCVSVAGYAPGSTSAPSGPGPGTPGHPVKANTVTTDGHPGTSLDAYMGSVSDFSPCTPMDQWDVGDTARIHATYYHPTGVDDAMGIMVAYLKR